MQSETFSLTESGKCGYVERRLLRHDGVRCREFILMDEVGCVTWKELDDDGVDVVEASRVSVQ